MGSLFSEMKNHFISNYMQIDFSLFTICPKTECQKYVKSLQRKIDSITNY